MFRNYCKSLIILSLLFAVAYPCRAQFATLQPQFSSPDRFLLVDWACFRADDSGWVRFELYYQIYNFGLEFRPIANEFQAEYKLTIEIDDNDGNLVQSFSREKRVRVATEVKTTSRLDYRTSQVSALLESGKYKVRVKLRDKHSGKVARHELKVKLPDLYKDKPTMSTVEFVQTFNERDEKEGVFDKGNMVVVPSVTRVYGGMEDSRLLYYFEIYPGSDSGQKVVVETRIRHVDRGMLYRDTLHVTFEERRERQLREVSMEYFTPGEYEMEIFLRGRRMKKLEKQKLEFEVLWTVDGILRHDWKTAVAQLDLIAEPGEIKGMKDLKSLEERRRAFEEFWLARDPSAGTVENETRREFYRRIAVANHHFRVMRREGWHTDRGYIYVKYGDPDEIVDEPFAPNAMPYQVWHYYTIGRYRRFVFVDENNDGDYRLQYPFDGLDQRPN